MEAYFISPLRRLGLTTLSLFLVLALLAASAPGALAAPLAATCVKNYVVQSGDTISGIAQTYKLTVAELAAANNLKEPYTLFIGQQLCIPGTATTTTSTTSTSSSSSNKPISVEFGTNTITVEFTKLTKNNAYMVKVMKVERGELDWVKLGKIKADKKGDGSATFKMPRRLRDATYFQICAKNLTDNKVVCARFRRTLSAPIS